MEKRLTNLESEIDKLLEKDSPTSETEKKMIVALAKEIRLANNYTLTENLEKLGNSELPSFDLFRREKAKTKRFRQRLIEKLEVVMGNDFSYESNLLQDKKHLNPIVEVEVDGLHASSFKLPLNEIQLQTENSQNIVDLDTLMTKDLKTSLDVQSNPVALALLGVEKKSKKGNLTNLISDSPLTVLDPVSYTHLTLPTILLV